MRETEYLKIYSDDKLSEYPLAMRNFIRKDEIYSLKYCSDFRIGMTVLYSMPSPASGKYWSGVGGIGKLFGKIQLLRIAKEEQKRVCAIIHGFIKGKGAVIAFQKDAYEAIRSAGDPKYDIKLAKTGELLGNYHCGPSILIAGSSPTRLSNSKLFHKALNGFRARFLEDQKQDDENHGGVRSQ